MDTQPITGAPFDVIVAGAGAAGVLAAVRLADARPDLRILLIEREAVPGGRLRAGASASPDIPPERWGYGLNSISQPLYDFWNQTLKADANSDHDLPSLISRRQTRVGILSGSHISEIPLATLCTPKGAKALGGMAAQKQWAEIDLILQSEDVTSHRSDHAFANLWKFPRKSPATIVMEHYAALFGIPDLWSASATAIAERAAHQTGNLYTGHWQAAFDALLKREIESGRITFAASTRIVDADQIQAADTNETLWDLTTDRGNFTGKSLVVAQPPWQAALWLPKQHWPAHLLAVVSKTKPVSLVVLTEHVKTDAIRDLPDVILIPAEGVQAVVSTDQEIAFQVTIDFEISLQAPEVGKAVKSLKRARRKLLATHPDLITESDRISLVPVGWAQSPSHSEHRYVERLAKHDLNSRELSFCGDAYGASYNGDDNLIKSVLATCEILS